MPFTTATANAILNKILRNTNFNHPAAVYVSLHTGNPGENGANEVTGGSYARKAVTFGAVSNKATSNTAAIEFPGMPAATLTHVGLWDASSGGAFWWGGALATSKAVGAGDKFIIPVGELNAPLT